MIIKKDMCLDELAERMGNADVHDAILMRRFLNYDFEGCEIQDVPPEYWDVFIAEVGARNN